jgi:phage baseplate assembly protein W
MPIPERKYKDLNLDLPAHPNTQDLVYVYDAEAIKRSVRNIILTNFYERHFDSNFGSGINSLLFENISYFTAASIQSTIETALQTSEPRISLLEVRVEPDNQEHGYNVTIVFRILNILAPVVVSMFLERVR